MDDHRHLIFTLLKFLQKESQGMKEEAQESMEVAVQCLETVYEVSAEDPVMTTQYALPHSLDQIFKAGMEKLGLEQCIRQPKDTAKAESYKAEGNELMKKEKYSEALQCYSKAIEADTSNAVYYCNRAAAHSKLNNHQEALEDSIAALSIDPEYSKAYGRKGLAHSALGQHADAVKCFKKALEMDPSNSSYQQNLEIAEEKAKEAESAAGVPAAGPGGLNMQGLDFSGLMNNPALMNMATSMMQNPQMQHMMANLMGNQGGNPQGLSSLLQAGQHLAQQMQDSNPELVDHLRNQMGNRDPNAPS